MRKKSLAVSIGLLYSKEKHCPEKLYMNDKTQPILCFGDSNTYGYDPRSYLGDRYPENIRWTGILREQTHLDIRNLGQPGREIPGYQYEMQQLQNLIDTMPTPPCLWIMLGSNDLLNGRNITAETIADRMRAFLLYLTHQTVFSSGIMRILLISPPRMRPGQWTDAHIQSESARLGPCMETMLHELCREKQLSPRKLFFADAGLWNLPAAFDGVHLTEDGHRLFAEKISAFL